ncbi:MAG TPA: hypothetical protein VHM65_00985, partial [Candidatus Lustribacter sp.]|nr:hypothetical protein [Candidatus Lustribacter sp.]
MTSTRAPSLPATTRWVLFVALAVLAALACAAASSLRRVTPTTAAPAQGTRVVLVGTGGLTWPDVSPGGTPSLWGLLAGGAAANLTVVAVHPTTCPVDAWVSLSAGDRAGQPDLPGTSDPACTPVPLVRDGQVSGFAGLVATAHARPYDAVPGRLAARLGESGQCVGSVGPGADLAAAAPTGAVTHRAPTVAAALDGPCRVVLVDLGAVADRSGARADRVGELDAAVSEVLGQVPGPVQVLVASLSGAGTPGYLGLLAARGPAAPAGLLASASTRNTGLVQSSDLTATLLARAGVARPGALPGAELEVAGLA